MKKQNHRTPREKQSSKREREREREREVEAATALAFVFSRSCSFFPTSFLFSSFSFLLPQLSQRHALVPVLAHHLGHGHLKVLLRDVDAALPQGEHAC